MIEILKDAVIDSFKLLPFLFITFLLMEYLEHKTSSKMQNAVKKAGKFGPIIGGILGIVPQCGFSVAATNLYAARIITIGTLITVYLTTSDEMIPILLSESIPIATIFCILAIKLTVGIISGFIIDFVVRKIGKEKIVEDFCEKENCHCEKSILKSTIKHTVNIFAFILIITIILNFMIDMIGEERITNFISHIHFLGPMIAGLLGLIPNCASSVLLSKLYAEKLVNLAFLISGLLVNAGVGILVLLRVNKNLKDSLKIIGTLYCIGVGVGIILQFVNFAL